jgi:hypothetical protein
MNRLPQELVERVCSFLPKDDLKNVLTLSRPFWPAAERYSDAFAKLTITEHNPEPCLALYSGHRIAFLREVVFRPSFDPIHYDETGEEDPPCRESAEQLREKDESFTRQIQFLFKALKSIEGSSDDEHARGTYRLSIYSPVRLVDVEVLREDCLHNAHVSWRVHLLRPEELPSVRFVRSLELYNEGCADKDRYHYSKPHGLDPNHFAAVESKLDLRVLLDIAMKFSNLEFLGVKTGGHEWHQFRADEKPVEWFEHDWEGPRRDSRHDFAKLIHSPEFQLPSSLRRASLDFMSPIERTINIHHEKYMPNLITPALIDPFSSSLLLLSKNLRQLRIRAVVDHSLFWPGSDHVTAWSNLEILEVMFHIARPDGGWYFHGPGGEQGNTDKSQLCDEAYPPFKASDFDRRAHDAQEAYGGKCSQNGNNQFRIMPHTPSLVPLLEGFAKATAQMPLLKTAAIWSPSSWDLNDEWDEENEFYRYLDDFPETNDTAWGIIYAAPHQSTDDRNCRSLNWLFPQWRPSPELHECFRQIGREKHGDELAELWEDEPIEDSDIRRYHFTCLMFLGDPGRIPGVC